MSGRGSQLSSVISIFAPKAFAYESDGLAVLFTQVLYACLGGGATSYSLSIYFLRVFAELSDGLAVKVSHF